MRAQPPLERGIYKRRLPGCLLERGTYGKKRERPMPLPWRKRERERAISLKLRLAYFMGALAL